MISLRIYTLNHVDISLVNRHGAVIPDSAKYKFTHDYLMLGGDNPRPYVKTKKMPIFLDKQ